MHKLYRVAVIFALWACCVTAESQTPFYGYYDSANLPGHGGPDNYTNQFAVNWHADTAVADQALADGQRLAILHQSATINLNPNNPGSLPNGLKISAYKWEPYRQAGVVDFIYIKDGPYPTYSFSEIETMVDLFKQNMPGFDIGLNFDAHDLGRPVFQPGNGVPSNIDYVGTTYYPYVSGSGPTNQTEFDNDFNPILSAMRAEVTGSQKLYLIAQGFSEGNFTQPDDQSPHFHAHVADTESDVAGVHYFKYASAPSSPFPLTGVEGYPTLEAGIKDAGQNDLGIPTSPAPIAAPPAYSVGLLDKWTFNNATGVGGDPLQSDGGAIGLTGTTHGTINTQGGLNELEVMDTQGDGNKGLQFYNIGAIPDRIDFESSHRYGEHTLDQLTIEAWVRQHGSPGKQAFVSKGSELYFGTVADVSGNVFLTGGFDKNLRAPLTEGAWHHVAYVIEGTNGGGGDMERIYINGVEAASRASQWTGIANADDDLNIGYVEGGIPHATAFRGVMDEVRIYDTALSPTEIASSFATGPEVPNPINLQTIYFEDYETGYSNGDPVTNKPEWTVGNATVVDSPGVLGGGTAAGLPDGHGLVLGGFVDTTENKVSFGDVTADKVYFSFDLYQTTDHTRGLTFDLVNGPQDAVDTVYAIWNKGTDVINHNTAGGSQPAVDYDMPENDWMHVEIVLDQVADTYDLMIGGELLLDDAGLQHNVTAADLISWSSHTSNGLFIDNILVAIEASINSGDFNGDGAVDAADYTVWRDNLGLDSSALNGNGSGAATVGQADYLLWKTHFGQSAASGSEVNLVPEPATLLLALLALTAVPRRVRHG